MRVSLRRPADSTAAACLVYIYPPGPGIGTRYDLGETPVVIGRDEECDVYLADPSVSRLHARIRPVGDQHIVMDLQSTNGTFVNERKATALRLRDGDSVRVGACLLRYLRGDNVEAAYHAEVGRLAWTDPLTGLLNKRALEEGLRREAERCGREGRPLAVVLFDADHFKAINDRLGHLAGDAALRDLAARAREVARPADVVGRYGGEEFALVLPGAGADEAVARAERLRRAVEAHRFASDGRAFRVTVSLGVAATDGATPAGAKELLGRADANLYRAKDAGRNRVVG